MTKTEPDESILEATVINFANITRHLILFLAFLTQGVAVSVAQQGNQQAFPPCSNTNLSGGYGFIVNGTTPRSGPYSYVGRFVADGKGGLTGRGAQAVNGLISRPTFTGTYTVKADCTGVAKLKFDYGGEANLELIIVDDGKTVDIMVADPNGQVGENEVGTATRQFNPIQQASGSLKSPRRSARPVLSAR
jgi:hypothetical protein